MDLFGEIVDLAASFFFAFTSIIFASAGRMVGSQVTNHIRFIFALIYLWIAKSFSLVSHCLWYVPIF